MSRKSDEWSVFFSEASAACFYCGTIGAGGLLLAEIDIYLQTAVWESHPISLVFDIGGPEKWENRLGAYEIFSWALQLPGTIAMLLCGNAGLFLLGSFSVLIDDLWGGS